jgi:hypothetical protein
MARCCGGATCPCAVEAGPGLEVTGTGAAGDAFVVGLDADTESSVADADSSRYGWVSPLVATTYYHGLSWDTPGTNLPPEAEMRGSRFIPGRDATLTRIGVEVTVVGVGATVVRLGLYSLNLSSGALTLVVDGGTIDGTVLGYSEVTISQAVLKGTNYFLMAAVQGGGGTRPTLRTNTGADPWLGSTTALTASQGSLGGIAVASVPGALPASVALGLQTPLASGLAPRVLVRTS